MSFSEMMQEVRTYARESWQLRMDNTKSFLKNRIESDP